MAKSVPKAAKKAAKKKATRKRAARSAPKQSRGATKRSPTTDIDLDELDGQLDEDLDGLYDDDADDELLDEPPPRPDSQQFDSDSLRVTRALPPPRTTPRQAGRIDPEARAFEPDGKPDYTADPDDLDDLEYGVGRGETNFPKPEQRVFDKWGDFYRYWQKVYGDPRTRRRLRVYGYRTYPVMLEGRRNVYKFSGDEAKPLALTDIAHRYGAGGYNLKINDRGHDLKQSMQICQITLAPGDRPEIADYQLYPPMLDPEDLDWDNPSNEPYLKQKRIQEHRYAEMENEDRKENEMRDNEQVANKLADALIDMRNRSSEASESGARESMLLVSHAAKSAIDMIKEEAAKKQAGEDNKLSEIVAVVKELRGDSNSSLDLMLTLMKETQQDKDRMHREQLELFKTMLERATEAREAKGQISETPPPNPNPKKEKNLIEMAKEYRELKDIMGDLFGKQTASKGTDWQTLAPMLMQAAAPLLQTLQNIAYAWAASAAAKNGQQMPPMQQLQGGGVGQPQQPGMGPQAQQAQDEALREQYRQQLAQQGMDPQQQASMVAFLEEIKGPLIRHVQDEERSGADFADFFADWKGEESYQQIAAAGPQQLLQTIKSYPLIWSVIAHREAYMEQFIGEFCTAFDESEPSEYEVGEDGAAKPARAATGGTATEAAGAAANEGAQEAQEAGADTEGSKPPNDADTAPTASDSAGNGTKTKPRAKAGSKSAGSGSKSNGKTTVGRKRKTA